LMPACCMSTASLVASLPLTLLCAIPAPALCLQRRWSLSRHAACTHYVRRSWASCLAAACKHRHQCRQGCTWLSARLCLQPPLQQAAAAR
jgi:hypothetical protein